MLVESVVKSDDFHGTYLSTCNSLNPLPYRSEEISPVSLADILTG